MRVLAILACLVASAAAFGASLPIFVEPLGLWRMGWMEGWGDG